MPGRVSVENHWVERVRVESRITLWLHCQPTIFHSLSILVFSYFRFLSAFSSILLSIVFCLLFLFYSFCSYLFRYFVKFYLLISFFSCYFIKVKVLPFIPLLLYELLLFSDSQMPSFFYSFPFLPNCISLYILLL